MATKHHGQRIFCDTDYLLDLFDSERSAHGDAVALLWYCAENPATTRLVAPMSAFKDAYYVLTRLYKSEAEARASIRAVMGAFVEPVDMLANYGVEAIESDEPDFEDGLIRACAEREGASVIVTRDSSGFATSSVRALSAADFLAEQGFAFESIDF